MTLKRFIESLKKRLGQEKDFSGFNRNEDQVRAAEAVSLKAQESLIKLGKKYKPLTAEQLAKHRNPDWDSVYALTDAELCTAALTMKLVYDNLYIDPAARPEEATRAIKYLQARLKLISNPLYAEYDFKALKDVPSSVLMQAFSEISSQSSDIFDESYVDGDDFKELISSFSVMQQSLEDRYAQQVKEELIDSLNAAKEYYGNGLVNISLEEKRQFVGAALLLNNLDKYSLHSPEDAYTLTRESFLKELSESIDDKQIEDIFSNSYDDFEKMQRLARSPRYLTELNRLQKIFNDLDAKGAYKAELAPVINALSGVEASVSKNVSPENLKNVAAEIDASLTRLYSKIQQDVRSGKSLSDAQIKVFESLAQAKHFCYCANRNEFGTERNARYDIGSKLVIAAALKNKNYEMLFDSTVLSNSIEAIVNHDSFKKTLDPNVVNLNDLNKKSGKDLLAKVGDYIDPTFFEVYTNRGQIQVPQAEDKYTDMKLYPGTKYGLNTKGKCTHDSVDAFKLAVPALFGTKENYLSRLTQNPEDVISKMDKLVFTYNESLTQSQTEAEMKKMFPDYKLPDKNVLNDRKQMSQKLQHAYYKAMMHRHVLFDYAKSSIPNFPVNFQREDLILNDGDVSPEGIARNKEFYTKYECGSPEEKKEALGSLLKRIGEFDITKFDMFNPQSILDNMDEFVRIATIGGEMQPIIARAREYGIDFNAPEFRNFRDKAEEIYLFGMDSRYYFDAYGSNAYAYLGGPQTMIENNFSDSELVPGKDYTYNDISSEGIFSTHDRSFSAYFDQLSEKNLMKCTMDDFHHTPQERYAKYHAEVHDMFKLRTVEEVAKDEWPEQLKHWKPDAELEQRSIGNPNAETAKKNIAVYADNAAYAKYKLQQYKDKKFMTEDGRYITVSKEEKEKLEKDILINDAAQKILKQPGGLYVLADEASFTKALEQGKTADEIELLARVNYYKDVTANHPEMVTKDPEFIRGIAFARVDYDKKNYKAQKSNQLRVLHDHPERAEAFLMQSDEQDLASQLAFFINSDNPEALASLSHSYYVNKGSMVREISRFNSSPYMDGLFAPQTDGSGMFMGFSKQKDVDYFKNIQTEIDAIKIDVPEGLSADAVEMATLGFFLDPEAMGKHFAEVKKMPGSTMLDVGGNIAQAKIAIGNFLQNSLSNDDRANMHDSRKFVPGARKSCKDALEKYKTGDKKAYTAAVYNAFSQCLDNLISTTSYLDEKFAFCCNVIEKSAALLEAEGYQFTEREKEFTKNFLNIRRAAAEMQILKKEIFDYSTHYSLSSLKANSDPNAPKQKLADDPDMKFKMDRYIRLNALIKMTNSAVNSYRKAVAVGGDGDEKIVRLGMRDINPLEKGFENLDIACDLIYDMELKDSKIYRDFMDRSAEEMTGCGVDRKLDYATLDGLYDADLFMNCMMQSYNKIHLDPRFADKKYDGIKTSLDEFMENYRIMRKSPSYKTGDLGALSGLAESLCRQASFMMTEKLDIDNFFLDLYSDFKGIREKFFNDSQRTENFCKEFDSKYKASILNEVKDDEVVNPEAENADLNPENPSPEELAAGQWFDSFVEKLKDYGVSYDNPSSLALVRELDTSFDVNQDMLNLWLSDEPSERLRGIKNCDKYLKMAFGNNLLRNSMYFGDDYANYLHNNMNDPVKLSYQEKLRLYKLAQEGNLVIQSRKLGPGEDQQFNMVKVGEDGKAVVLNSLAEMDKNADQALNLNDNEQYKMGVLGNLMQGRRVALSDLLSDVEDKYAKYENGHFLELSKQEQELMDYEKSSIISSVKWCVNDRQLITRSIKLNSLFNDEKSREMLGNLVSFNQRPESIRSNNENNLLKADYILAATDNAFDEKLCKYFKINSLADLPLNRILDSKGQPFGEKLDYESFNKMAKSAVECEPFILDGKPVYFSYANSRFVEAANLKEYETYSERLLTELTNTDSFFSHDTDGYTKLKEGMTKLVSDIGESMRCKVAEEKGIDVLKFRMNNIKNLCNRYIEDHKNITDLSDRQMKRLGVISKILNMCNKAEQNVRNPINKQEQIAEDMVIEAQKNAMKSKKPEAIAAAKSALLNRERMQASINNFMADRKFRQVVANEANVNELLSKSPKEKANVYVAKLKEIENAAQNQPVNAPQNNAPQNNNPEAPQLGNH